jgi:predicted dehydrogenase
MNATSSSSARDASSQPAAGKSPPLAAAGHEIGYAVIGLGHITQVAVLPGFAHAKNSRLVALVSGDRKKLQKLGKQYEVEKTFHYEQFDECLADPEVDAVYIGLPNDLHFDCVLRAAAAGKHILCEKPLALNATEARGMIQAARDHDVKLMTAYRLHFEPANLATIELIKSGKLGEPRYFSSNFSYQVTDPDNIRLQFARGGGPIYDIGIYCINAARYLMQDEPIEVTGMLARSEDPRFNEVEETASAILRFPRGRLASFNVSFGAADVARYEFVGTKGRVVLEPAYEYSEGLKQIVTIDGKTEEKSFPKTDQFGGEIEHFTECILEGREPEPSGAEGLADVRIIEAIFDSDASGRTIRFKPTHKGNRPGEHQVKRKRGVKKPATVHVTAPHD